jgi:hypothetical protein
MKIRVPSEHWKAFERLPRKDRPPFSEIAAAQSFKLIGWATVTGGVYLLQERSGVAPLGIIPYLLWILIVWDMSSKIGVEPEVERGEGTLDLLLPRKYWLKLTFVALLSGFVAWVTVFWLASLVHRYGLASI